METRNTDEPPKNSLAEPANVPVEKAYDPGWNDPPPMSYESASGRVRKGILNKPKRIAFPLDTTHSPAGVASSPKNFSGPCITPNLPPNSSKPPAPSLLMPPMHSDFPPSVASAKTDIITTESNTVGTSANINTAASNKEQCMESVQAVFNKILDTINEIKDVTEIKKRLGVMALMWKSNKLDVKVQQQMFLLAEALEKGHLTAANEIQKSLAVNHTSQCSTWMAGVRKLVQYASSENASSMQTSVSSGQSEVIVGDKNVAAGADLEDVGVLATKVQNL